jgi:hypothetical protein
MAQPQTPTHGLGAPTESDVLTSLTRFVGEDRARDSWQAACASCGARPGALHTPAALEAPLNALKANGGYEAVAASSLLVRIRTYALLSRQPALV